MPSAASTIVEALGRYPRSRGEDQLTELFALVLQTVPELSRWFIGEALKSHPDLQPPADGLRLAVFTQSFAAGSGRPDMTIDYFDSGGRARRILSEHKIDADFTDIQRTAYERWHPRDALILVAPHAKSAPSEFDRHISWTDVGREAERIARDDAERGGREWRRRALEAGAPRRSRLLVELLVMLESDNVGVDRAKPVDLSDILVYQNSSITREQMATLVSMIREEETLQSLQPSDIYPEDIVNWWFTLDGAGQGRRSTSSARGCRDRPV